MLMQRCPTILNSTGVEMNAHGFAMERDIGRRDLDPEMTPSEGFGANAGAMLVRSRDLRELGGFDERYFMYFEDVDLSWRYRLAGRRILYAPAAVVTHDWYGDGISGDRESVRLQLGERNRIQNLLKNYGRKTLGRLLPAVRAQDRLRLASAHSAIARGEAPEFHKALLRAITVAWRWNLLRAPWLLWSRWWVQRLRRVYDEQLMHWIHSGGEDPRLPGDVRAFQDRYSAKPGARIAFGPDDRDLACLGAGWFHAERDSLSALWGRWTMGTAWFYLQPECEARWLRLRLLSRPTPTDVRLDIEGEDLGCALLLGGESSTVLSYRIPEPIPPAQMVEFRIVSSTFCPREIGPSEDPRTLGVRVAEIWLE
jgi:hypothetical protein